MSRHYYYWIVVKDNSKPYLVFGSDVSEDDCRQKGLELLGGVDFEIRRYPTRDISAASAMYRGKRLAQTHSIKDATRRIGHDKSLKRARQRAY